MSKPTDVASSSVSSAVAPIFREFGTPPGRFGVKWQALMGSSLEGEPGMIRFGRLGQNFDFATEKSAVVMGSGPDENCMKGPIDRVIGPATQKSAQRS